MHILVTGAAGFLGPHLARRLVHQGHRVVGVDAFTDYYDPELKRENARMLGEHHRRSYTYVSDIVDGLVALLDHRDHVRGEIFNLGNDWDVSTMEVIDIVQRIVGYEVEIERRPRHLGDQLRTCADITKARAVLGYAPCVDPEARLEWTVASFQERARSTSPFAELR